MTTMKMNMKNHKKVTLTSSNLSEEKLAELHKILPEAFSENKIDWNKLRAVIGNEIDERIEKFSFTWAGKSNAIKNVLIPSKATLRPAKDESIKFDSSENLFIEGDNLEVLKLLQKAYFEQVKMIYIDPPYNTGGDFVYHDDFSAPLSNYLKQTGQKDGDGASLTTNRETSGRFHSDWLSMMYPRLKMAWNLLRDDGVIFVSIDDNEVAHLRMVMDEIFGEENFVAQVVWEKMYTTKNDSRMVSDCHEYVLIYTKNPDARPIGLLPRSEEANERYSNPDNDPRGAWKAIPLYAKGERTRGRYPITSPKTGKVFELPPNKHWLYREEDTKELISDNRIWFGASGNSAPNVKRFLTEVQQGLKPRTLWKFSEVGSNDSAKKEIKEIFGDNPPFDFPKPSTLIRRMIQLCSKGDDIILDFFAGSGTTAQAILEENNGDKIRRKFILVQFPEATDPESEAHKTGYTNIADIAKDRIRRVIKGYGSNPEPLDNGFKVFKLSESNYPENNFEFDPAKSEEENKKAFADYLAKAKQTKLFDDTKAVDVVYENVVKEGLSLNSKISETKLGKNEVYVVADGEKHLLVCLDKKIDDKTVSELTGKDYKGKVFICLDNALDDSAKANIGLNVELKTI